VDGQKRRRREGDVEKEALYEEIGRLKVELDWPKKNAGLLEEAAALAGVTEPCRNLPSTTM